MNENSFGALSVQRGFLTLRQLNECLSLQHSLRQQGKTPPKIATILIKKGHMTVEQAREVIDAQRQKGPAIPDEGLDEIALADQQDLSFGAVAIDLGLVTIEQVDQCLADQRSQKTSGPHHRRIAAMMVDNSFLTSEQAKMVLKVQQKKRGYELIPGYRVLGVVGRGAMGTVYKSLQVRMEREVAIKILSPKYSHRAEFVQRFFREARAAAKVSHANIIQGIDVGEHNGLYYFVMEYVEGKTVGSILAKGEVFEPREACSIIKQVAAAMEAAWTAGLLHRDIKPDNIMVTDAGGVAKLCDLGLAKAMAGDPDETDPEFAVGTPDYISPEQSMGSENIDIRSDIYSLGSTFYHMVTGQLPFTGMDAVSVMRKHATEILVPPRARRPSLPIAVNLVIQRMMEKNAAARYQQPAQLIRDLEAILAGQPPPTFRAMLEKGSVAPAASGSGVVPKAPRFPTLKRYRR
ncbi:MAG: serine/threonine protein kinase [Planctomycetes bacterium]|nr:serine/threonine protein kinase [Planctomycetota bacterium]